MSYEIRSYPSIYAVGHHAAAELFDGPVVVEEKIDGSQFSFGVDADGNLHCRSKGKVLVTDAPEKMFERAVATAKELADDLTVGWTYRGEYLQKPKHNTLAYGRVPEKHVILYDVDAGHHHYLSVDEKRTEAGRIGLEIVPVMHEGRIGSVDELRALMASESCLGGCSPEGLVIKNYAKFGPDKKTLMGKYVTEAFKESHKLAWKASNPSRGDVVQRLIESYRTEARWRKSVQHLREAGTLEGSPRDIGALIREVPADVLKECREEIAAKLFEYAWPQIQRGIVAGLPQWYKDELAKAAFEEQAA
jgi:hypothetical protein